MDIHSRSMNNSVGQVVTMPRNKVDDVRANTCSEGLHFCSLEYLPHFGSLSRGDRTVIVKINPADVVSIPQDYNNAKGRTCRYQVVAEHDSDTKSAFDEPVVDYTPDEEPFVKGCDKNNSRYDPGTPSWAIEQAHVMADDDRYFFDIKDIRDECGVGSTTEFRTDPIALARFYDLHKEYMRDVVNKNSPKRDAQGRFCK